MTKQERTNEMKEQAREVLQKCDNFLPMLWARWQDEREYEDFNEYVDVMKKGTKDLCAKYNMTFVKATKRPFGFQLRFPEGVTIQFYTNSTYIGMKQAK